MALPKSWPITKLTELFKQNWLIVQFGKLWRRPGWRRTITAGGLIAAWLLASYVLFRRYPNNYRYPNFYAEDGPLFGGNLAHKGLLGAIGTTFNGYYIAGLYIIEQLSNILNHLVGGNELVNLPRSLSVASYSFLGFCVTLPLLMLRRFVEPAALWLITILLLFVPLLGADYIVLGTIGSLKFSFVFIAFVLLIYRHLSAAENHKLLLVDLGLLICAYTNITVYFLMPFALLRYWPQIKSKDRRRLLYNDQSFRLLVILGLAMLPQLYFIKRDGIPTLPGYLDTPYRKSASVELFVGRSYLYGFLFAVYHHLTNLRAMIAIGILGGIGWFCGGKYRSIFLFGVYATFITTATFVLKRTGISSFFGGYQDGGFDQFFYAQNWIFELSLVLAFSQLAAKLKPSWLRRTAYVLASVIILFGFAPRASSFGRNNFMAKEVGTIYQEARHDCQSSDQEISLSIYPQKFLQYEHLSRGAVCTKSIQHN